MGVWDDLRRRLVVQYASEAEVQTPSPEDLDRFERESGFRLPDDYRDFAATFGPGTYGPGWQVETPGFANAEGRYNGLAGLFRRVQDTYPGFVVFCGKEDFHGWFAWDPKDVTDPGGHDYGVYVLGGPSGEDSDAPPLKAASSFREFVLSYALGGGFKRQLAESGYGDPGEAGSSGPVPFAQVL
jgi:hypothetical protein